MYIGFRGGDIHTMFLLANGGTGAITEALRCTGRADCVNDAKALFTQSALSFVFILKLFCLQMHVDIF